MFGNNSVSTAENSGMKIFTTDIIKEIDRYTIENEPIASVDLMERAASAVVKAITTRWGNERRIAVFAGTGNNGGDALAAARLLGEKGYAVETYLFNPHRRLSPDCEANLERLKATGATVHEIVEEFTPPRLSPDTLVIDGLFGSGLNRPLEKAYAALVQYLNASGATIVSIDIPSGMAGEDNGEYRRQNMIHPALTLTLQFPKLSFFTAEETPLCGEWEMLDIGLHPDFIREKETPYHYTLPEEAADELKLRQRFSDKYDYGHLLVAAGSRGMMGAAVIAARAALHSGAGLVSLHTPACGETIVQTALPEALFSADRHASHISDVPTTRRYDAAVIGPGIGRHDDTRYALSQLLPRLSCPTVLDADALNLLSESPVLFGQLAPQTILTPHHREFDRLFGESETQYERLQKARDICLRHNIIVVLKGAYTAVVAGDGSVHFNSTGNAGMATAGSGDALAGIIGALLAQHYTPLQAATLGTLLHGMAGDLAAREESQEYVTAGEIIRHLGQAFAQLHSYRNQ